MAPADSGSMDLRVTVHTLRAWGPWAQVLKALGLPGLLLSSNLSSLRFLLCLQSTLEFSEFGFWILNHIQKILPLPARHSPFSENTALNQDTQGGNLAGMGSPKCFLLPSSCIAWHHLVPSVWALQGSDPCLGSGEVLSRRALLTFPLKGQAANTPCSVLEAHRKPGQWAPDWHDCDPGTYSCRCGQ